MKPVRMSLLRVDPYARFERKVVRFSLNTPEQREHSAFRQSENTHLLERIVNDLRYCDAYKKLNRVPQVQTETHWRNIYGHCTHFHAGTQELFCNCCKFQMPEKVVETTIANYFVPFYDPEMYRGVSIDHLMPVDTLDGLSDEYTLQDFCQQQYTWHQLVTRHYSRLHWRAVRSEQERMLLDWIDFMRQINSAGDIELKEAQREIMFNILLPELPTAPSDGAFLCRKTMESGMREAIAEQVKRHYEECQLTLYKHTSFQFPLCEIIDVWLMHELKAPSTPIEHFIDQTIHRPERIRRIVNACRNWFEEALDLLTYSTNLTSMTFMNEPNDDNYTPSSCDLQFARYILDQKQDALLKTFWCNYTGGTDLIRFNKYFVCNEFFLMELLQHLCFEYTFEYSCIIDVIWNSNDKQDSFYCGKSVYGISYPCVGENARSELKSLQEFFEENCICSGVKFNKVVLPSPQQFFTNGFLNVVVSHDEMDTMW